MNKTAFNKAIDDALENVLADLAQSNSSVTVMEPEEQENAISAREGTSRNDSEYECVHRADTVFTESGHERVFPKLSGIIDHKLTLLAVAGAAVKADAEPCLDKIVHELEGTGVTKADIREAVESGRFLGIRPDLADEVFADKCGDPEEQESVKPTRSRVGVVSAARRN